MGGDHGCCLHELMRACFGFAISHGRSDTTLLKISFYSVYGYTVSVFYLRRHDRHVVAPQLMQHKDSSGLDNLLMEV